MGLCFLSSAASSYIHLTICRGALTLWPGREECCVSSIMLLENHACDIESAMNDVRSLARTSRSAIGLVSPSPVG